MEKRVFIETFGCQMNDNDTDRMLGLLNELKYTRTTDPENADFILVNTCSIRDKAEQKVYSAVGRFKKLKQQKPSLVIGISGCVAQQQGHSLLKRMGYVDMVVGTNNIHRLGHLLSEVRTGRKRVVATKLSRTIDKDEYRARISKDSGIKAFVSIMRGCDNFCSYCIVPYTRGSEVSRPGRDIVEEIQTIARLGIKEVTLIGQNVNSYGKGLSEGLSFPGLLRRVCAIDTIERVRFITSHPKDISVELIRLFADEPKLCRHIHLPVQSGSDSVLERMRRGYTRRHYLSKVWELKRMYPDMAITTDIIVGFPDETEREFDATMELIRTVEYDNIFSFKYSTRPKTDAAVFEGHISEELKGARLNTLQTTQKEITMKKNRALVGRTMKVLVEGKSKALHTELMGRTTCNRPVNFPAPKGLEGSLTHVLITDAYANSLRGMDTERSALC